MFDLSTAKRAGFQLTEPSDGALISGLYFEGANWDKKHRCICEQEPKVLYSKAPVIWLLPKHVSPVDPSSLAAASKSGTGKPSTSTVNKQAELQRLAASK